METASYEAYSANPFGALGIGFWLFYLAYLAFIIIASWKVFEKAGQPGWACLVPIYNVIIMLRIIGKPWWWLLLCLIPFFNFIWIIVMAIWGTNLLSKSFGKDVGFTIGLLLLAPVFIGILAFDKSIRYIGPAGNPNIDKFNDQIDSIGNPAV